MRRSVVCPPGARVYFLGGVAMPFRVGGALFARKEGNCIQVQNNTAETAVIGIYEVSNDGSTYVYDPAPDVHKTFDPQEQVFWKRPEFKRFGDREIVVTFNSTGKFMRRVIRGGFSGLKEAPNSFFVTSSKIEARNINFADLPAAKKACS